jgi:hypothetical protein
MYSLFNLSKLYPYNKSTGRKRTFPEIFREKVFVTKPDMPVSKNEAPGTEGTTNSL